MSSSILTILILNIISNNKIIIRGKRLQSLEEPDDLNHSTRQARNDPNARKARVKHVGSGV